MQTSENQQALGKILDMTRMLAIGILALHFYYFFYSAFVQWKLVSPFSDRILDNIVRTGLFSFFNKTKIIAVCLLGISLLGVKGKKQENLSVKKGLCYIAAGLFLYFGSSLLR